MNRSIGDFLFNAAYVFTGVLVALLTYDLLK